VGARLLGGAASPWAGGADVNFLMDEGDERIRATYRDNYDRLVGVKRQYDPTNQFYQNQNIRP
jgi:FAD/FMN-containing dehydrogenase